MKKMTGHVSKGMLMCALICGTLASNAVPAFAGEKGRCRKIMTEYLPLFIESLFVMLYAGLWKNDCSVQA